MFQVLSLLSLLVLQAKAFMNVGQDSTQLILANDRFVTAVTKSNGRVYYMTLDVSLHLMLWRMS